MIGGAKGIGIGIDFGIPNQYCRATNKPYIEKDVLDSLRVVASAYGKTNNDSDRAIVKNLVDPDNPFIISNAAYKLNSGYGKYEVDFTTWSKRNVVTSNNDNSFSFESKVSSSLLYYSTTIGVDTPSFKIKANISNCIVYYYYINDKGTLSSISILESGEFELPISHNTLYNGNIGIGFEIGRINGTGTGTITQIPSYQGAFVTDGVDDLITSTKTVQEMLGGSTEFTAVSMIHLTSVGQDVDGNAYTNYIRTSDNHWVSNRVSNTDKTGIYGYSFKNSTPTIINNILGDKNDYTAEKGSLVNEIFRAKFSVEGFEHSISGAVHVSSVAWYWTVIANKVLTTDQINQVIAYFNLDRTLNPDILCNTIKQGITNENHAEFGDKLIDFSGNGRDIQLNNIAWKGDSGIGKYETELSNTSIWTQSKETTCSPFSSSYNGLSGWIVFANTELTNSADMPSFKIQVKGLLEGQELIYRYYDSNGQSNVYSMGKDGEYTLPSDVRTAKPQTSNTSGFQVVKNETNIITITQIPSHAGALYLDGVSDFGKVTGMPIYKDYTFIIDRQIISIGDTAGVVASKSEDPTDVNKQGAFLFEYLGAPNNMSAWSFYKDNGKVANTDFTRGISYQSTYSYNGKDLTIGTSKDSDKLWLGTIRDNDSRFFNGAIYSLMSFPYSMSEFLIERQLKKHKLGTLYPDMVEFRPVIKANNDYEIVYTAIIKPDNWQEISVGDYVTVGESVAIQIKLNLPLEVTNVSSNSLADVSFYKEETGDNVYTIYGRLLDGKSPQKISLTIEQDENYVKFEPVITSNVEYVRLDFYLNNYQKRINIGDYIPKDVYLRANLYLKNNVDELTVFTFNGVNIGYRRSSVDDTAFNINQIYNYDSPQEVNITIDEYIRYEDIVQPYPVLLRFNDENGNEVSWGGKFKVGSTITRIGSAADSNLLPNIYNIFGLLLNENQVTSSKVIVEKTMVFKAKSAYIFDDNEPKCILSPRLLRIPNSSYKILGYIPDISGHGNNGKINNSAYAGMSGANGYPYDYNNSSFLADSSLAKVVSGELVEYFAIKNSTGFSNITSGIYKGKIKVTGVTKAISENKISRLRIYTNSTTDNELIDITQDGNYNIDIKGVDDANRVFFYAIPSNPNNTAVVRLTEPIYIEQIGEYEGAYCLDGVDDFVTIPTLSSGGKQVLMKANWNTLDSVLYDQRNDIEVPFCIGTGSGTIAYNHRNVGGNTFIDGILNNHILTDDLQAITHNIVLNNDYNVTNSNLFIGTNFIKSAHTKMSLYDFMLFDDISTDDKIKELNEYVGIEGNVWGILTQLSNSTLISNETLIKNE